MKKVKKEVFGFDVVGKRGINDCNDFSVVEDNNGNVAINIQGSLIYPNMPEVSKNEEYFYNVRYNRYDYEDGYKYYMNKYNPMKFGCSSFVKGDFYARSFDWYYDNTATFKIETDANQGRHATQGTAALPEITEDLANSGEYSINYKYLPFRTLDGRNDAGVYCSLNVVPVKDKFKTVETNPNGQRICTTMVIRYLLDYANSVEHAIELFKGLNIYATYNDTLEEEYHFMIANKNNDVAIIEFAGGYENNLHIMTNFDDNYDAIPNGLPIMTNFYLTDWNGEAITVMGGYTKEEVEATGLTPHSAGIERYNILKDGYENVTDFDSAKALLKSVKYTKLYKTDTNPLWYSELVGNYPKIGDMTIYNTAEDYTGIFEITRSLYEKRTKETRNQNIIWQSVHQVIYDMANDKMYVFVQEEDEGYEFEFKTNKKI